MCLISDMHKLQSLSPTIPYNKIQLMKRRLLGKKLILVDQMLKSTCASWATALTYFIPRKDSLKVSITWFEHLQVRYVFSLMQSVYWK